MSDTKQCSKCSVCKSLDAFHKGQRYAGGYRGTCKVCAHRQVLEWQRRNPDKTKATRDKTWAKHRELLNAKRRKPARAKVGRQESSRRYYQKNKSAHMAYANRWWHEHPELKRAKRLRREAEEVGASGVASASQISERVEMFGGLCWLCGSKYQEIDHVIALTRGGTNWPANLRPICKSCNSRKCNRDWREYIAC